MHPVVTLFDVDNTLLDNDRVVAHLMRHMDRELGHERQQEYWEIFETLRNELGYADYLGALQRYRMQHPRDSHALIVSSFLVNYPFANRLFPQSLDLVAHPSPSTPPSPTPPPPNPLAADGLPPQGGPAVIVSDGDVVFQPRKIDR